MKRLIIALRLFVYGLRIELMRSKITHLLERGYSLSDNLIIELDKRLSIICAKWTMLEMEYKSLK